MPILVLVLRPDKEYCKEFCSRTYRGPQAKGEILGQEVPTGMAHHEMTAIWEEKHWVGKTEMYVPAEIEVGHRKYESGSRI